MTTYSIRNYTGFRWNCLAPCLTTVYCSVVPWRLPTCNKLHEPQILFVWKTSVIDLFVIFLYFPSGLQRRACCVPHGRGFEPQSSTLLVDTSANTWIKKVWLPCWPLQSAGVTPEVDLRITQARKHARDPPWLWTQGYQWPHKKDLCPPNLFCTLCMEFYCAWFSASEGSVQQTKIVQFRIITSVCCYSAHKEIRAPLLGIPLLNNPHLCISTGCQILAT